MSLIRNTLLVLTLAFASLSFAGVSLEWKEVGNGGKILLCDSTVQALDVYEAQVVYYLHPHPQSLTQVDNFSKLSIHDNFDLSLKTANKFLLRLKKRDADLWEKYSELLQRFRQESFFLTDRELAPTPDEDITQIPATCELRQLIVQRNPIYNGTRYVIDRKLWLRLPSEQQAAMIIHEIVYSEALERRKDLMSSRAVRRMTGLILSQELATLPQSMYEIVKKDL
ncbi:MAG: hypothetical protein JSU04_04635 [Bdellovibrionales bacterium]|nr:hypothetical protein [Bdellovibrionales bacterium]